MQMIDNNRRKCYNQTNGSSCLRGLDLLCFQGGIMKHIDPTVMKETKYIASWVLILSVLMQAIFLVMGKWDYTVLLGNLLSATVSIVNFFLMGLTVQHSLNKEEKEAKAAIKASQMYRNLLMLVVLIAGVVLPCFSTWTVLIPVIFPRIAIACRPLLDKRGGEKHE